MLAPLEASVARARRRLFAQGLMTRLPIAWAASLAGAAAWVAAGPHIAEAVPLDARWPVVGGLVALGTVAGVWWARRGTPSATQAALEIDNRFGLAERVTTALGLSAHERETSAGRAVLADAADKVAPIHVRERFPVQPRWHAALVPAAAAAVALFALVPVSEVADLIAGEPGQTAEMAADKKPDAKPDVKSPAPNKPPELAPRPDKSKELKNLEDQKEKLDQKYDNDPARETPEKLKEKAADLSSLENKAKKFTDEKAKKLEKLDEQLKQLSRLNEDKEFDDGPAKKLNDALQKGDLKKAQSEVDQLKKKVKDKELSKEDTEKLVKQLDKMKNELEKSEKNKEREQKLEDAAKKARQEGREQDAESLERELKQVQQEQKEAAESAQELKQNIQKAKEALEKGNLEEAAKELGEAAKSLEKTEGELQDLEDADQFLQRLKGEKKDACKKCQGEGEGDKDKLDPNDDYDGNANNPGAGRRKENKDAKTKKGDDERVRGIFDPTGRKIFGGTTKGKGFRGAAPGAIGPAIQSAAQEAPGAADSQRLPRDAKDTVKEYFEALGGHKDK